MLSLLLAATVTLQQPQPPKEVDQLKFWVGEWTCEGILYSPTAPKETKTTGSNSVTLDFDGFVLHEHFQMPGFKGESWSVYNANQKRWHQTWVDNSGAYIALQGECKEGKLTLTTLPAPAKPESFSRMVFSNIKPEGFDWDWESSTDGGKSWTLAWHLHYTRKK